MLDLSDIPINNYLVQQVTVDLLFGLIKLAECLIDSWLWFNVTFSDISAI